MSSIIIANAPKSYQSHLNTADAAGNNNGKIDSNKEAVGAAKSFFKANPTRFKKYHKFLMYLEGKGFKLRPRLADEGTTLFVTTHYMDEAEFCRRISIMHRGKIVEVGEPRDLVEKYRQPDLQETFIHLISELEKNA